MTVSASKCRSGRVLYYRLGGERPDGRPFRFRINWAEWTRAVAAEALDLLEVELGVNRKSVRFRIV